MNGNGVPNIPNDGAALLGDSRDRLREARIKTRLLQEQVRAKRLEHVNSLLENTVTGYQLDWVTAYQDLLSRYRNEPNAFQVSTYYDRRYGKNYPLFQNETELSLLRMPSRVLCGTNGYGIGLMEGLTSYVISTGYVYRSRSVDNKEPELAEVVQSIVDDFLKRNQWQGGMDEPSLEEELFWRSCEDGEFILLHFLDSFGYTTVRTVEPEQLTQTGSPWSYQEGSFGILTPADDVQKRLSYWIFFGDNPTKGQAYEPDRITHFRRNSKRSIKRGLPDFTFDVMECLEQASKLRRNMVTGAAIQAAIALVRQYDNASQTGIQSFADLMTDYQKANIATGQTQSFRRYDAGTIEDIPKGMEYVRPPSAENASAYVSILQACLRGASVRWNAPEWIGSGLHDTSSFASSLTAESPFVRTVQRRQKNYKEAFLRSVNLAISNYLKVRGYLNVVKKFKDDMGEVVRVEEKRFDAEDVAKLIFVECQAPSCETRSKLEEAEANKIRYLTGWKSIQTIQHEEGLNSKQEAANIATWQKDVPKPQPPAAAGAGATGGASSPITGPASPPTGLDPHEPSKVPKPGSFMPGGWRWPSQKNPNATQESLDGLPPFSAKYTTLLEASQEGCGHGLLLCACGNTISSCGCTHSLEMTPRVYHVSDQKCVKCNRLTSLEESAGTHEFASTQFALPPDVSQKVVALGKSIPDEELAGDRRETDIHITALYGIV